MDGTHLASSRSAWHNTGSRATVSASTFAMTAPSASRAALQFSTGPNEISIAFRDDPPREPRVSSGSRARGFDPDDVQRWNEETFDPDPVC